jgi:hypothetical protein
VVGASIADQATVSGGLSPTGTVTFKLYNNPNRTGTAVFTSTKPLSAGTATSGSFATTAAGTYYWVATYNGDAKNGPSSSGNADEPVTVAKATPTLSTSRFPISLKLGASMKEKATLTARYRPTGQVTFRLYKNSKATGKPLFTSTVTLVKGSATSGAYKPKATGTYYWVVTYSGDAKNVSVSSGTASQPVTVHR